MTAESLSSAGDLPPQVRCPCGWARGHAATDHPASPRPPRTADG